MGFTDVIELPGLETCGKHGTGHYCHTCSYRHAASLIPDMCTCMLLRSRVWRSLLRENVDFDVDGIGLPPVYAPRMRSYCVRCITPWRGAVEDNALLVNCLCCGMKPGLPHGHGNARIAAF